LEEDIRDREAEFNRGEETVQSKIKVELRGECGGLDQGRRRRWGVELTHVRSAWCADAELRDRISVEEQAREEEDCVMLDSMLEAQKELQVRGKRRPGGLGVSNPTLVVTWSLFDSQRIILENFGAKTLAECDFQPAYYK
jgi:hypothetical protein